MLQSAKSKHHSLRVPVIISGGLSQINDNVVKFIKLHHCYLSKIYLNQACG